MNANRRKDLQNVLNHLSNVETFLEGEHADLVVAREMCETAASDLANPRDEEQDYYDNMPENFQQGEKGDNAQNAIDNLDNAISALENVDENSDVDTIREAVEEAIEYIEEAMV